MTVRIHNQQPTAPDQLRKLDSQEKSKGVEFSTLLTEGIKKKKGGTGERIHQAVSSASQKYNLSPALILGVIKQESNFKPNAKSHCGAQGLMQLMPGTARDLGVRDAYNIEQNIDGGCKYLRRMLNQFGGDTELALAAYNAGPGRVQQYGGIPPIAETQNYVPSVLKHAGSFNNTIGNYEREMGVLAILEAEAVNSALASAAVASQPLNLKFPDLKAMKTDDSPPPPPPGAMRV